MERLRILDATPGPPHQYPVRLSDSERRTRRRQLGSGAASARTLTHARVLLKADPAGPAWTDSAIRDAGEVSLATIAGVRRAFVIGGLDAARQRKPPARQHRRRLDGRQAARLIALSCGTPPPGQARWSLRLLTQRFIELQGTVVSDETGRRVLKQTRSRPGCNGACASPRTPLPPSSGRWRRCSTSPSGRMPLRCR